MPKITNTATLLDHGDPLRAAALDIAEHALAAADPYDATRDAVVISDSTLCIKDKEYVLDSSRRIFVFGTGKATFPIAKALDEILGDHIYKGLVVCKTGQIGQLRHIDLHLAAHPIPDVHSLAAGVTGKALLSEVSSSDIVITCVTGGSSALFVAPVDSVSLHDKAEVNHILLTCGADIREINAVRKSISTVKGGRLIKDLPAGATLINLTVSDVTGDPLEFITDLTVPDTSTIDDARNTLDKYGLWGRLSPSVCTYLARNSSPPESMRETDLAHIHRQDVMLVAGDAACTGAAEHAKTLSYKAMILSSQFEGESRELARTFAAIAREVKTYARPLSPPCVLIGGGETTVCIHPEDTPGMGGPNQAFALAIASELRGMEGVVALGLDTDGTDGPTDAAGGLVDGTTANTASSGALNVEVSLNNHDAYTILTQLDDIVLTGNTGTNVNDLKLLLIGSEN